jgi:hypothetical protein
MTEVSTPIDLYAEIVCAIAEAEKRVYAMNYKAGVDKLQQMALDHLHALGVREPGLDVMAAIDSRIALSLALGLVANR